MSTPAIRKALENALAAMPGALTFARQNKAFKSVIGTPYAEFYIIPARPDGSTLGAGFKREVGILQFTLCYPANVGTDAAEAKADEICTRFKRGSTLDAGGIRVLVDRHPEIGPSFSDAGWYRLPVRVPFVADVFGAV